MRYPDQEHLLISNRHMATDVAKVVAAGVADAGKVGGVRLTFHYHLSWRWRGKHVEMAPPPKFEPRPPVGWFLLYIPQGNTQHFWELW